MQLTFGDAEGLGQRNRTRREVFLDEMEQVVPWRALLALFEPHYPVAGRCCRQPYALRLSQVLVFLLVDHWGLMVGLLGQLICPLELDWVRL